jgi:hypothetical protein
MAREGSIYIQERSGEPSIRRLQLLAETFDKAVWLNPVPRARWGYTHTITVIRDIFPMFELSIDGLEDMVAHLMTKP